MDFLVAHFYFPLVYRGVVIFKYCGDYSVVEVV